MKQQNKQAGSYTEEMSEEIQVQFFPAKHGTYVADLFGYIHSPGQFSQIVTVLDNMQPEDQLIINLCSLGGSLSAISSLLHAINKTEGSVHICATGSNASAATLVLLAGDSFELSEDFEALLHNGSFGVGGNFNEVRVQSPFALQHMEKVLRNHYQFFLSDYEIDEMLKGVDIALGPEEWCERVSGRLEKMQAKMVEIQKASQKATRKPRVKKNKKIVDSPIQLSVE